MKTKHTTLPWIVSEDKCDGDPTIRTADDTWVVATTAMACPSDVVNGDGDDASEANAEFIVRACNSHYELLEALNSMLAARIDPMGITAAKADELAREAIAKANGSEVSK